MPERQKKILIAIGILAVSVVVIIGFLYQNYERKNLLQKKYADLNSIADLKERQISGWLNNKIVEAEIVGKGPYTAKAVENYLNNGSALADRIMIMERLNLAVEKSEFDEIFFCNNKGEQVFSVGTEPEIELGSIKEYVVKSIQQQKTIFTNLYLCNHHSQRHLDIIVPLDIKKKSIDAALVFRINKSTSLLPIISSWPIASKTGESVLIEKDRDKIVMVDKSGKFISHSIFSLDPQNVEVLVVSGKEGITEAKDNSGKMVLADLRKIKGTDWYIISKITTDEVFEDINYRINLIILIVILFVVSILTLFLTAYHYRQRTVYKKLLEKDGDLRKTQSKFMATLYSIGDGVIVTDANSIITHMNNTSELLTEWKENEAVGKPLEEIFRIINEETRMKVENPVKKVLKEGAVVGLANHTLLISKSGKEIPIADSGAPIREDSDEILGVVLVFRDQTDERRYNYELKESRDKFLSLYNNMNEGVALHEVVFDSEDNPVNYKFIDVNPKYESILEIKRNEIVGKLANEVYGTSNPPYLDEFCNVAITKESIFFETYFPALDKYFEFSVVPWSTFGFATIFTDVTIRKRNELEIKTINERWISTFNSILDPVAIVDSNSRILLFNKAFETKHCYDTNQINGMKCFEIVHNQNHNYDNCPLMRAKTSGKRETLEYNEGGKYYSITVDPIIYDGKLTNEFVHTIRDLTEARQNEEALIESEERFRRIFFTNPDSLAITRIDSKEFIDVNPEFESMMGVERSEIIYVPAPQIGIWNSSEDWQLLLNEVNEKGIASNKEVEIIKKDGSKLSCLASASKLEIHNENFVLLLLRDITERIVASREMEMLKNHLQELVGERTEALERVNSQLFEEIQKQKEYELMLKMALQKEQELNELKTRFVSTISHEFRTPLTSIFSSTELIERKAVGFNESKYFDYINRIKKSVDYLTRLLDEVIVINKAESGNLNYEPEMIELKEFCEEIIEEARITFKELHNFTRTYNLDSNKYFLDRKLMKFIVSNLISNACKYSPNGGNIELEAQEDDSHLIIKIKDEGIGIPDEDKPYIFDPFSRSRNSGNIPGTGLGLSIVKRSIDLFGGEISFTSHIEVGTQFIVKIPKKRNINEKH